MRLVILGLIALLAVVPAMAQDITPIAGTHWQLVSIDGAPVIEGSSITLDFDANANQVTGNGGCNGYSATFTRWEDTFTFSDIVSTRRACADASLTQQEQDYFSVLQAATWFEVNDDMLTIWEGDQQRLVFTRAAGLVGPEWQLVSFGASGTETPVIEGSSITLQFNADNQVSGNGGCNGYGGGYAVQNDSIMFSEIVSTLMACADGQITQQESTYFAALNSATHYELSGDTLTIWYGEEQQLNFERSTQSLVGTHWQLIAYGASGAGLPVVGTVTLEFLSDSEIAGSAGCNSYGGQYEIQDDTIIFTDVFSTLVACDDAQIMEQEAAYLEALQSTAHYQVTGDTLSIWYGSRQQLDFVRVTSAETVSG